MAATSVDYCNSLQRTTRTNFNVFILDRIFICISKCILVYLIVLTRTSQTQGYSSLIISHTTDDGSPIAAAQHGESGSHREACTEEEAEERGCYNGECSAISLDEFGRITECICEEGYMGETCAEAAIPPDLWSSANILVPLVTLGVLAVIGVAIGIPLFIYQRRMQRQNQATCCVKSRTSNNHRQQNNHRLNGAETQRLSVIYTPDMSEGFTEKSIHFTDGDTGLNTSLVVNSHRDDDNTDDDDDVDYKTNKTLNNSTVVDVR